MEVKIVESNRDPPGSFLRTFRMITCKLHVLFMGQMIR